MIQWNNEVETGFDLVNPGESPIHFKLLCFDPKATKVSIIPAVATLNSKESVHIVVKLKARDIGEQTLGIFYGVRRRKDSDGLVEDGSESKIFRVEYSCCYPTLKASTTQV